MSSIKIKRDVLLIYALFIAIFKPYFVPTALHQAFKLVVVSSVVMFLLIKSRKKELLNCSIIFGVCVILSSFFANRAHYISNTSFLHAIYYAICFYCVYTLFGYFSLRNRSDEMLMSVFNILLVYCLVTFFSYFFPLYVDDSGLTVFAFGNKFTSSYLFMMFIAVFYTVFNHNIRKRIEWRLLYFFIILLAIMFAILVECSTVIIASAIFLLCYFIPERIREKIWSPNIVALFIVFAALFPVLMKYITQNRIVRFIIVDILGESITINYRNIIYKSYLFPLIEKSPIFGFGYANVAMAELTKYSYGNAQNAMFDIILDYGILGAVVIFFTIIYCYKISAKKKKAEGLLMLVYAFVLAGTIEVTYSWLFFFGLFMLRWIDDQKFMRNDYYERYVAK